MRSLDELRTLLSAATLAPAAGATAPSRSGSSSTSPLFVEPIWSFWQDASQLLLVTRAVVGQLLGVAASQSGELGLGDLRASLPTGLAAVLREWFDKTGEDPGDYQRAEVYRRFYGLLPALSVGPGPTQSPIIELSHAALVEAAGVDRFTDGANTYEAGRLAPLLRQVHVALAEAVSQPVQGGATVDVLRRFVALQSVGREDMLIAQWIMNQPEVRDAGLQSLVLVAYPEMWMATLDAARARLGMLGALSVYHDELARSAEALLLSIRFADPRAIDDAFALDWARFWRPEVRTYLGAFRRVTGGDIEKV